MIKASNEGICGGFWRKKQHNLGLPTFKLPTSTKPFKTNPLNIIFDDFSIWLLGYNTEYSCLYLPQGHVWLCRTDEYVCVYYFERKSAFKSAE